MRVRELNDHQKASVIDVREVNENNQFHHPTDLAFDSNGNLYVSDAYNHCVQFFALIDNRSCQAPSTTTVKISTGNSIILVFFSYLI
ncbi:unnamed protein product [Rotaria sordida]|uniref:Uncharacterized protein n=1 Tax=Rotaria sordida TaxID=392033 RepID=A0A815E3Z2_9BILA|nr:unnamed protein product [Rotaria sordida]CAF1373190.1 unnamed protein product [Rotaria sordida]CAF1612598.1 unnamed protein product [Rotaria sordida]